MANVANGQIFEMIFVGELDGQTILNTFHYTVQDSTDPTKTIKEVSDALNLALTDADGLGDRFDSTWLSLCPPQYQWVDTWIQVIHPTRYVKEIYVGAGNGTNPHDGHWANSAAVITRRAEKAGRKYISALHAPLPSELDASAGLVPAAYKIQMDLVGKQVRYTRAFPVLFLNLVPIIYHRGAPGTFDKIVSTVSQRSVRVMRRRTVGLGI